MNGELQVALVVERHGLDLPQRVFAVEHPAVGAAQERVGDVAQPDLRRGAGACRRPGPLDPLPLEIARNLAAGEVAGPRVADRDRRAADQRAGIEKRGPRAA
jgi:hypothetical protein